MVKSSQVGQPPLLAESSIEDTLWTISLLAKFELGDLATLIQTKENAI